MACFSNSIFSQLPVKYLMNLKFNFDINVVVPVLGILLWTQFFLKGIIILLKLTCLTPESPSDLVLSSTYNCC